MKSIINELANKDSKEIDIEKLLTALFNEDVNCDDLYKKIKDTSS